MDVSPSSSCYSSHFGEVLESTRPSCFFLSNIYFPETLRSEKEVNRIEAVGYCFGGFYALLLGSEQHHLVDAIVGCHVSMTTKDQFEQLHVPAAFACAQEDNSFSDAARTEAEQILARKSEIPSKFLVTEGTVHGFAARPNPDNPVIMKGYKQANDLIAEWAKAHL
jgi:carboxymethylenebutenolidase